MQCRRLGLFFAIETVIELKGAEGGALASQAAGASGSRFSDAELLPRTCGEDGTIHLEPGVAYRTEAPDHTIDKNCKILQGSAHATILIFASISFTCTDAATVRGPLTVMMPQGSEALKTTDMVSLRSAAMRSLGDLIVQSPEDGKIVFRNIRCSSAGAALDAGRNIFLDGPGSIHFENLYSLKGGAAARANTGVINSTVSNLRIDKSFGYYRGGAFYAGLGIHLHSDGIVRFEDCTSSWRGGALSSRGDLTLTGSATYLFRQCSSKGKVIGGGALSAIGSVVVKLDSGGSATFHDCTAPAVTRGGSGGAISSNADIYIISSRVVFEACWSGTGDGNAMIAARGKVIISADSRVSLSDSMTRFSGSAIFALTAILPVDADMLSEVLSLRPILASKSSTQGDDICPAGSRFTISDSGLPRTGECRLCGIGTAALAPTRVQIREKIKAPAPGMRLALVTKDSPNAIECFEGLVLTNSSDGSSLGLVEGDWDPNLEASTLKLGRQKLNFTFDRGVFRTADGWLLAVPFGLLYPDTKMVIIKEDDLDLWTDMNKSVMFRIGRHGEVGPAFAPGLVLGFDHEVVPVFDPPNPYKACVPCHLLAKEFAEKLWCKGATHVSSLPGYMLFHEFATRTLEVHACPNSWVCPGSNLSLTAEGELTSSSRLCSDGYERSRGCMKCIPGYGRQKLDPFTCRKCRTGLLGQLSKTMLLNGLFYIWAMRSARPRTNTRQIFKMFLAFLAISCRSLAAVPHTRHFGKLKGDFNYFARMLRPAFFTADVVISAEPGLGANSFDCWFGRPLGVCSSLALSWATPLALLLISFAFLRRHCLRSLVIWGNVFAPGLFGAAAMLGPCVATQDGGRRVLMYEATFDTQCASTVLEVLQLPRFWLAMFTSLLLFMLGPVLWLSLANEGWEQAEDHRLTIGYLVAGYRPTLRWWEVTVLARKAAIYVVATSFPMSWAPGTHLIYLLGIILVAELVHVTVKPYENASFNRLEAQTLGISAICLALVLSLLVEWPFMPYSCYVVGITCLFLITGGMYFFFIRLYLKAAFAASQGRQVFETEMVPSLR